MSCIGPIHYCRQVINIIVMSYSAQYYFCPLVFSFNYGSHLHKPAMQAYRLQYYVRQESFETTSNNSASLLSRIQLRKYLLTARTLI